MSLADRRIVHTRLVDAPIERVWEAWTDPAQLARWWGPAGFTRRTVERPTVLTFVHSAGAPDDPHAVEGEARLQAEGARTRVTLTTTLRDEAGARALDRLAAEAESYEGGLVLDRVLRAPRARVWAAWTDPAQLGRWWGPAGFAIRVARAEIVPGGRFVYSMDTPDGSQRWWGRMLFREVTPMERIAWINSFSDPEGGLARAPFAPDFPAEVFQLVTLADVPGGTRLTLRARPIDATEAERALYASMHPDMLRGTGATFDQLAALVEG